MDGCNMKRRNKLMHCWLIVQMVQLCTMRKQRS